MTDGMAIGSQLFLERLFAAKREFFSERRKTAARRMKGGDWGELRTARALKVDPISPACAGDG